jgi:hypothetical protein
VKKNYFVAVILTCFKFLTLCHISSGS